MDSIAQLCDLFWGVEQKYRLFELEVNGVKVWQAARTRIFYTLAENLGLFNFRRETVKKNRIQNSLLLQLKNALFRNPLLYLPKTEVLIFCSGRYEQTANGVENIYLKGLFKHLEDHKTTYLRVDLPDQDGQYPQTPQANSSNVDAMLLYENLNLNIQKGYAAIRGTPLVEYLRKKSRHLRKWLKPYYIVKTWSSETSENLVQLENKLCEEFSINCPFRQLMRRQYLYLQLRYEFYIRLLNLKKPSRIYLVCSYFKPELVAAAKALNIECIEVQHGNLDKYHIGYSYPDTKDKPAYFPDKFMSWGAFWTDFPEFPLDKENVLVSGFAHFWQKCQQYGDIKRQLNQIVIVSQSSICQPLAAALLREIEALSDYKIVYKLHPSEYESFKEVPELMELLKYPHFSIQKSCDLYALFAESQYVVGVYSTALYEAIGLGCSPAIMQAPGWEMMTDLINRYNIPVITAENPLHQIIMEIAPCNIDVEELFLRSNAS